MVLPLLFTLVTASLFEIASISGKAPDFYWLLEWHRGQFGPHLNVGLIYPFLNATGLFVLVGTGISIWWQVTSLELQRAKRIQQGVPQAPASDWVTWKPFVVDRKVKESEEITSFYLKPQDGQPLPGYKPGQFLTIQLMIPGLEKPVIRTYSLSDYPGITAPFYRLSIKRELPPKGLSVPPGIASNFMHDHVQEGAVIQAKPPAGKFFLDVKSSSPVVLISNGVGITPMISMAKACTEENPGRPVLFVHGARNGTYHAFYEEVLTLAKKNPNLKVYYRYSRPNPEDEGRYYSQGYADIDFVKEIVAKDMPFNQDHVLYYLCGSPDFLNSIREGFKTWGIPDSRVFFEVFGKLKSGSSATSNTEVSAQTSKEVICSQSQKTFTWQVGDGTILEKAEQSGIYPPNSCRSGICLTCMTKILEGEVDYIEPPTGTPDPGSVLICISKPKTAEITLEM
jgi:ferredoxin-NADP reductase